MSTSPKLLTVQRVIKRSATVLMILSFGLSPLAVVILSGSKAQAAPNFQMPFPCGETWWASTRGGHNAIDWNIMDGDDLGRAVVASLGGTATGGYSGSSGHYVVIDHGGGWSTRYIHLKERGVSGNVSQGQVIGRVGNTGNTEGRSHLHWEQIFNGVPQSTLYANGSTLQPGTAYNSSDPQYTSNNNCGSGSGAAQIPVSNGGGDLNGDGQVDLIGISRAGDGTPYVNAFISNSSGTGFLSPTVWSHPTSGWADWGGKRWLVGSFGSDQKADLVGISRASDGTPYIYVFPSRGNRFGEPQLWSHPTSGWKDWDNKVWLSGDATGDGMDDLIGISRGGDNSAYIHVFESTGNSFKPPVLWAHASDGWKEWETKRWLTGDFGGDGRVDLMGISRAGDGSPKVHVFPSRGDEFGSPSLWAHPISGWKDWAGKKWLVGNVGNDNRADLIGISRAGDGTPYVYVFPSRGDKFGAPQLWTHPTSGWKDWSGKVWITGDYGTDGKADLLGISRGGDDTPWIYVFPSRGDKFGGPMLWSHPTSGWADWSGKKWL